MKTNLAERLKQARMNKGLTQKSLADLIGVSQAAIQKIETGKAANTTRLVDLAKALNVRPEWLSSGNEPVGIDSALKEPEPVYNANLTYRVDVLDVQASAGPGTMLTSDFIETIRAIEYTPDKGRALFGPLQSSQVKVITVSGDSMEGTIDPGDEIFVNVGIRDFDGDGIYVFVFGNTLHVKRLQMHKDRMLVLSDNDRYKEWYIEEEDHDRFHIMAKVLIKQTIAYKRFG